MPEHKRSYKPGRRNLGDAIKMKGRLSTNKWAWVKIYFGTFVIWADYVKDADDENTEELQDLKLMFTVPGGRPNAWNLTACTEEELISLKHLLDTSIEWALPIARQRDKDAQNAFDNGDDSHSRIYRTVPQLVYRQGPVGEYSEGVQHGSENAPDALGSNDDRRDGLPDDGPDVAEPDEARIRTQDDGPTTD